MGIRFSMTKIDNETMLQWRLGAAAARHQLGPARRVAQHRDLAFGEELGAVVDGDGRRRRRAAVRLLQLRHDLDQTLRVATASFRDGFDIDDDLPCR